jgi:hypothetical protein
MNLVDSVVTMAPAGSLLSLDNYNIQFDNLMRQSSTDPATGAPLNDDKSTNAPTILAINGALCFFTLVIVLARFYVRTVMLKSMGTDDWLIGLAMACGVATFICFVGETHHGIGMHSDAIPFTETIKQLHWNFVRCPVYNSDLGWHQKQVRMHDIRSASFCFESVVLYVLCCAYHTNLPVSFTP